jgi:hypothetical protein
MLTLVSGKRIVPTRRSTEFRSYSAQAVHRLKTDLLFWHLFQVHWLHALHFDRLGPDLGGYALEGYPPCILQEAASNLIFCADYQFLLLDTKTRTRFPLTEGLLRFVGNPLRILPVGQPGLWVGKEFHDFPALSKLYSVGPKEVYDLFIRTIEEQ